MKLRRITAIFVCVILSLTLVACGGGNNGGENNPSTGNDPTNVGGGTTYTVKFDVGEEAKAAGVTNPADITVKAGGTITLPEVNWADHVVVWKNGDSVFNGSIPVTGNITLVGSWSIITQYDKDINSGATAWSQPGHLYIHYNRGHDASENDKTNTATGPDYTTPAIDSATYGDWGVWVWPRGNSNGKLFNAARIDETGAIYDILIAHDYTNAGWDGNNREFLNATINYTTGDEGQVGFQIHSIKSRTEGSGFWINDGGDNFINLKDAERPNGSYHWYVSANDVSSGTAYYTAAEVVDRYKDYEEGSRTTRYTGEKTVDSSATPQYEKGIVATDMDDTAVGYQIFIPSFCDSDNDGKGDLQGVISKLDYLKGLNVDILWLTPFQNSTGYHGYDITDYYSVDPKFGTLKDYRELVYKAHEKGMKIVMDFVLNHTALANPWFQKSSNLVEEGEGADKIEYRNFYNWINESQYNNIPCPAEGKDACPAHSDNKKKHTCAKSQWFKDSHGYYFYSSFGSSMPELNYDYQPVRDAIVDVAKYWMEFGLDGFRLDAVKHIYMKNEVEACGTRAWSGDNSSKYNLGGTTGYLGSDGNYSQDIERNLHFYNEFNYKLKKVYPNAFIVGENLTGNPAALGPYFEGIDSQFNFNLYYDVSRAVAKSTRNTNNVKLASAMKAWKQCYDGGDWDAMVSKGLGFSKVNPNYIDGAFTSNHDLPRARDRLNIGGTTLEDDNYTETFFTDDTTYEFLDNTTTTCKSVDGKNVNTANVTKTDVLLRLYYAFQMMVPGVSWIYNGDEIGMTGLMQYTVAATSTSSTDSQPHEDVIYRQPVKWHAQTEKGTKDNASFDIGYGDVVCQLQGLNATKYVQSVDEQSIEESNPKAPTTLLNWVKLLTQIRNDYGLAKATLTDNNGGSFNNNLDFTLTSTGKNTTGKKVRVKMYAATSNATSNPEGSLAYYNGVIDNKNYTVIITAA